VNATLLGGVSVPRGPLDLQSVSAPLRGPSAQPGTLDATIDAASVSRGAALPERAVAPTQAGRSTVLPRRKNDEPSPELEAGGRPRFDRVRLLGKGGTGEVELARDNDIRRTVAVKRLNSELVSHEALLRFADEIRVVGQLEHPGIVPIYDVGRDDTGQVYLMMKHLHGETMEDVIAKLRG
jgi:hypothetical protein